MDLFEPNADYLLLYDGGCPICRRSVAFLGTQKGSDALQFVPLQTPGVLEDLAISKDAALKEIHVIDRDGRVKRGADAVLWAMSALPHWRWLKKARRLPGFNPVSRLVYQMIASRRKRDICTEHSCG